jgi:polyvinyl alcohol dehydrogenase (cytochrome)
MPKARILRSLDFGAMMTIAYAMARADREAVSEYLGAPDASETPAKQALCGSPPGTNAKPVWNGWSPTATNTRFQTNAGITLDNVKRLRLKWSFVHSGDVNAMAQPTIIGNVLYTGSASGAVYALNAKTGCIHWVFQANGPVRTAPRIEGSAALFADQIGWVYSINTRDGKLIWKKRVEDHDATRLTAAFAVHNGIAYVPAASWEETRAINNSYACCTFRGSVSAVRITDGHVLWKTYLVDEPKPTKPGKFGPSGAGVWSTPTVDPARNRIYITTGDNYSSPATNTSDAVIALNLESGRIEWVKQTLANDVYTSACGTGGANCPEERGPDHDYGSPALLVSNGKKTILVAGQKSGMVYAFDPDRNGEIIWQKRVGAGGSLLGGVQWGMAADAQNVYASVSDSKLTRNVPTDPSDLRRFLFDPSTGGGLTALRIADGEQRWRAEAKPCAKPVPGCSPAQSAALTAIPGVIFSGSMDGHLRAYSAENGAVLWDFDTLRDFDGVNGPRGHGGSIDGPGPVIANGMLYINSGYARFGGMGGNVLLAFGLD